jgi:hypothetical protein
MDARPDLGRRVAVAILAGTLLAVAACGEDAPPQATVASVAPSAVVCSDTFDRGSDLWALGQSDQQDTWRAVEGRWGIDALEAAVTLDPDEVAPEVPLALLGCETSGDLRIDADITLSPTALRANAGLAFRAQSGRSYLWIKVQRTKTYPEGAIAIAKTEDGETVPRLEQLDAVGLENGRTYHVVVLLRGDEVQLQVSGGTLGEPAVVSYTLTAEEALRFDGGLVGLRSRMDPSDVTEDDGGSRWDDLVVSTL